MKKTVLANWGLEKQGKSDVTKRLAKLILANYPDATVEPSPVDYSGDIKVIITIGKIKIGVEGQGDPGSRSRIYQSLPEFAEKKCDLIICTCRTYGNTVKAVEALHYNHGYDVIWVTNHRSNEKDKEQLNQFSAQQLFELFKRILADKI